MALTKADMAEYLYEQLGLNKREAKDMAPEQRLQVRRECQNFCVRGTLNLHGSREAG